MRTFVSILALLILASAAVQADDLVSPTKAYNKFAKKARGMSPEQKKQAAQAWLAKWEAAGKKAESKHVYSLALFQLDAGQIEKAAAGMRAVQADMELKERTRDLAASSEGNMLLDPTLREALGKDGVQKATDRLCKTAAGMGGDARKKARSKLSYVIANLHEAAGNSDDALAMRLKIVADDASFISKVYGLTMRGLLGSTHSMTEYDALRTKATATLKTLSTAQSKVVAEEKAKLDTAFSKLKAKKPDALDADGKLKQTDRRKMTNEERTFGGAQRKYSGAVALLERIGTYAGPFQLLGKPAPEWTAEKAYGDVAKIADLKGKVALLYFWGTARKGSIRSLPAIRELGRDYGEKGLTVVGVTTPDKICYETRFDLDPEFADKASGGRPVYYARLATERTPANENQAIYNEEQYSPAEIEAIKAFAQAHEMTWPIVLIDEDDPADKYSLDVWPHSVVLDKQGRIRFLKAGSVKAADLATVIEALLGES